MPKEIKLAKYAGFCYGVKRAVETAKRLKRENPDKNICILGEIIHNAQVIEELNSLGIKSIDKIPEHGNGICIIRSHGESPQVFEQIKKAGFEVYDLTCPDVKKVQKKAIELVQKGYYLVIVGKSEHPEVIAINANAKQFGDKIVVADKIEQLKPYEKDLKNSKIGVVVQTTQMDSTLAEIEKYLKTLSDDVVVENTICASTRMRRTEAEELAKNSDLMIVTGSKKSANTSHLAQILGNITKTIHIESDSQLDDFKDIISRSQKIGVTAGASTPKNIIDKVIETVSKG